jgi:hypothetical protein
MSGYVRLLVPADVADDLVSDGIAVRPIGTRGGVLAQVVTVALDVINAGGAVVSIATGEATYRRLAQAFIRRYRPVEPNKAKLTITVGDHTESLDVDLTSQKAEEQLFDFFAAQLHVV